MCSSSWLDSSGNTCTHTEECVQVRGWTQAEPHAHTRKNVFEFLLRLRRKHMHTLGRMCLSFWFDSSGNTCRHTKECVQVPGWTQAETHAHTRKNVLKSSSLDSGGNTCTHSEECAQVPA